MKNLNWVNIIASSFIIAGVGIMVWFFYGLRLTSF